MSTTSPNVAKDQAFDVDALRAEFPILARQVNNKPLVYFDNAATSQKPVCVLTTLDDYYRQTNANIHRGLHTLAEEATAGYEGARGKIANFIGAGAPEPVIFTRGTTEAINLIAQAYARPQLKAGDEVIVTQMEHHSNLVPWQLVCEQTGATLRAVPITDDGQWDLEAFEATVNSRTKLIAVNHVSNSLGTINPVKTAVALARSVGAVIVVDGAQATPHLRVDVTDLDCDFYALSGHKMYGPTGIGALYGKRELLESMPPWQGGGEMIQSVTLEKAVYQVPPYRFEAGTPDIAGSIGLGAAVDFLQRVGLEKAAAHEDHLRQYATDRLSEIDGLRIIGTAPNKAAVVSFLIEGVSAYDLGALIDQHGIAVRTGHHCTQPIMDRFGIPGTVRASFAMYNTTAEIDQMLTAIPKVLKMLR